MNRDEFIATVAPVAVKVRIEGGALFPSVSIAQTILETGGKVHPWNNIVGYKVGSGKRTPFWDGRSINTKTHEYYDGKRVDGVTANWRVYDSIYDCLKDQALLFFNNRSRYQRVIDAKTPESQASMLQSCGYATDPKYPGKLISIIESEKLEKYDKQAVDSMGPKFPVVEGLANVVIDGLVSGDGYIINDRVFVPVRVISERLGASVTWDGKTNTVEVKTK